MFGLFGILKMLPLILGMAGVGYLGHWFITKNLKKQITQQQGQIIILTQENIALKISTQKQQEAIDSLELNIKSQIGAISGLTIKANKWEELAKKYNKIFYEHDFTKLSQAKPGLIEKRANNATRALFDDIEESTKETGT